MGRAPVLEENHLEKFRQAENNRGKWCLTLFFLHGNREKVSDPNFPTDSLILPFAEN